MAVTVTSALSTALLAAAPATKAAYCSAVISAMSGARKIELLRNGVAQRSAPMTGSITTDTLSLKFGTVTGPVTGTAACNFGDGATWTVAITAGSGYAYGYTWAVGTDVTATNLAANQTGFGVTVAFALLAPASLPGALTFVGSGSAINQALHWTSGSATSGVHTHIVSFKKGVVPSGQFVAAFDGATQLASQCRIVNKWVDNSAKQVAITYSMPTIPVLTGFNRGQIPTGTKSITFQAVSSDPSDPSGTAPTRATVAAALSNFTFSISGTGISGSFNLQTLLAAATYCDTDILSNVPANRGGWLSGALLRSYVIADHAGGTLDVVASSGVSNGVAVRCFFEVMHYPTISKTKVSITCETSVGNKLGDVVYTASVSGPVSRTSGTLDHRAGMHWTKDFWIGGDPDANDDRYIVYPWQAWADAGSTLNHTYPAQTTTSDLTLAIGANNLSYATLRGYDPLQLVLSSAYNGNTGGRTELGPDDYWGIQARMTGDPQFRHYAKRRAEGYHNGQCIRETNSPTDVASYDKRFYIDRARTLAGKGYPITQEGRASWRGADEGAGPFIKGSASPSRNVTLAAEETLPLYQNTTPATIDWSWADNQHTYQLYHGQYLMSAEWRWVERAMCLAAFVTASANNYKYDDRSVPTAVLGQYSYTYGPGINIAMRPQAAIRGPGWAGMTLANALVCLPDGHPVRDTFVNHALDNLVLIAACWDVGAATDWAIYGGRNAIYTWAQNLTGSPFGSAQRTPVFWRESSHWTGRTFKTLGFLCPGRQDIAFPTVTPPPDGNPPTMDFWEQGFYCLMLDRMYGLELPNVVPLIQYATKLVSAFYAMSPAWEISGNYHYAIEDSTHTFWQTPAAFLSGGINPSDGTTFQNAPNYAWADKDYSYYTLTWAAVELAIQVGGASALRTSFRNYLATRQGTYDYSTAYNYSNKYMIAARV